MIIKTTLYIHNNILRRIHKFVGKNKKLRSNLIISLLKRAMRDNKKMIKGFMSVKYQQKDSANEWNIIHIAFKEDDYEYFIDMRKLYKMSVSLILAYAVRKYLFQMMTKEMGRFMSDNYYPRNYLLSRYIIGGIICWKLHWGFPADQNEIFR